MIHLDYRDARPIYTQICDGIRDQILAGILQQGDRLPSVRELATQLTINPNTIQRAYRELELQGWVISMPGKGSFVSGIPSEAEHHRQSLLEQFDKLCRQLSAMGMTQQALLERIQSGGDEDDQT